MITNTWQSGYGCLDNGSGNNGNSSRGYVPTTVPGESSLVCRVKDFQGVGQMPGVVWPELQQVLLPLTILDP